MRATKDSDGSIALPAVVDLPAAESLLVTLRKALTDAGYTVKTIERTDTPIAEVRSRLEASSK